ARFAERAQGFGGTAGSLGRYLQEGWNRADPAKARLFGFLGQVGSLEHYQQTLQQLGGQQLQAMAHQAVIDTPRRMDEVGDCPDAGAPGVRRDPDGCIWLRLGTQKSNQSAQTHNLGYEAHNTVLRAGVQRDLGNDWHVGATLGAQVNRLEADGYDSKGNTVDAAVAVRRDLGRLSMTGAVGVAYGRFDNTRSPQLGRFGDATGLTQSYESRSRLTIVSGRASASYTFGDDDGYVKPALAVDVMAVRTPGVTESDGPLALSTSRVNDVIVAVTPKVEVGKRFHLNATTSARAYASGGVSWLPDNTRSSQNRLRHAASGTPSFESRSDGPAAVARLNLGVQVWQKENLQFSVEAQLESGRDYRSYGVSARLQRRF
ncbi:MAG: autotransporter domain-containing protein, partial [Pigmentiphaga sp.]